MINPIIIHTVSENSKTFSEIFFASSLKVFPFSLMFFTIL